MWNRILTFMNERAVFFVLILQTALVTAKGGGLFTESWFWALLPLELFLFLFVCLIGADILYDKISGFFGDGRG